jgi:hypothetical protein
MNKCGTAAWSPDSSTHFPPRISVTKFGSCFDNCMTNIVNLLPMTTLRLRGSGCHRGAARDEILLTRYAVSIGK